MSNAYKQRKSTAIVVRRDTNHGRRKKGNLYTEYDVINVEPFVKPGVVNGLLKDFKAGLVACDGVIIQSMKNTCWFDLDTPKPNTPFDVSFDYLRISNQ